MYLFLDEDFDGTLGGFLRLIDFLMSFKRVFFFFGGLSFGRGSSTRRAIASKLAIKEIELYV